VFELLRSKSPVARALGRRQQHTVLLLRDPFNLAASRIKHYHLLSAKRRWVDKRRAIGQWEAYAQAYQLGNGRLRLRYNDLLEPVNEARLKELTATFGGEYTTEALKHVDVNGLGSSFDGREYEGKPQEMKTNERWREYRDVEAYWGIFTPEIRKKVAEIFGEETANTGADIAGT
jgi:hypothetical protein